MDAVPAKLTPRLIRELDALVKSGWYSNRSEAIRDAVRNLVERTKLRALEEAIEEDIRWGLRGTE